MSDHSVKNFTTVQPDWKIFWIHCTELKEPVFWTLKMHMQHQRASGGGGGNSDVARRAAAFWRYLAREVDFNEGSG